MGDRLYLLAPGNKGTSDAFRSGWERIWGKRKGDVKHDEPTHEQKLWVCFAPDSRKLEHFSKHPAYEQE